MFVLSAGLVACGGGSSTPDLSKPAIAEAMTALDAGKPAVARAYSSNNRMFPPTANPPMVLAPPANAKYVTQVAYNAVSGASASVVVTLDNTNNEVLDGKFIAAFATGQVDGTVTWVCGTAVMGGTTPAAVMAMYPYLPPPCQH
jgi:type IV pilus assembly protein PilA